MSFIFHLMFGVLVGFQTLPMAFAKAEKKPAATDQKILKQVFERYAQPKILILDVEQQQETLLGSSKSLQGVLTMGSGQFHWKIDSTPPSQTIFDGKAVWNIQEPDPDFGGKPIITKAKVGKNSQGGELVELLNRKKWASHLKSKSSELEGGRRVYSIDFPLGGTKITDLKFVILEKSLEISEIHFQDELKQQTKLILKNFRSGSAKEAKKLFKYQPPPEVQVNEI